ncbi:MAG: type IV secretion protein IcmE [Coxiellaceae bacterium]|nr:type IV secretion protein IcmE [Coxiellaceae bacterium]
MNNMKTRVKSLGQSKSRLAIILGASIIVLIVGVTVVVHLSNKPVGSAKVLHGVDIESLPGSSHSSQKYIEDQKNQNYVLANKAKKEAKSAVPTITRASFIGNPADFADLGDSKKASQSTSANCPLKKMVVMYKPNPASCTVKNLQLARKTGVTAEELLCQGCMCPSLKLAGYTVGDLKNIGLTAKQLKKCGFSLPELVQAGFSAKDLKEAGFSNNDLKNQGFSPDEIAAAQSSSNNCSVDAIKKKKDQGVTAAELKKQGCGVAALKAAGFTANQLKDAGFSAKDLKDAGFSAKALKAAGFSAKDLKDAGYKPSDLVDAGYSDNDLKAAGFTPDDIKSAKALSKKCSVDELKKQRDQGVSAVEMKKQGCGLAALKAAGFTAKELKAAGFSAKDLKDAGFSPQELKAAGFSAKDLKDAGFSAKDLKDAGYSAADLKNAGFSAGALKDAGFSASDLADAGFSPKDLRNAGFTAADLKDAGFTPDELKDAGFTKGDLLRAGFTPDEAGYTAESVDDSAQKQSSQASSPTTQTAGLDQKASTKDAVKIPSVSDNDDAAAERLRQLAERQQQKLDAQQRAQALAQAQSNMMVQSQALLSHWGDHSSQALATAPVEQNSNAQAGGAGQNDSNANDGKIYKAGTVMFAVLDTSINSDETTPIMASIVSGPLKGSKLLGNFKRYDKKLMISFNVLNNPKLSKTIAVNAVAIDPDTARTALSGEVNNHYLLRYGSLFAASFMQGMGEAYQSFDSNSGTVYIGDTYNDDPPNATQVTLQGLGQVGQSMGNEMKPIFNKGPTIKINSGTGMGLLLMKDLTVPYGDNLDQPSLGDDTKSSDSKNTKS